MAEHTRIQHTAHEAPNTPDPAPPGARGPHARLEVVRTGRAAPATLPRLRVLPVPRSEADLDPPGARPASHTRHLAPVPNLRLAEATGGVSAGLPAEPLEEPDPREARARVRRFALVLAEVLTGTRPLRQLHGHVNSAVRGRVEDLAEELRAQRVTHVTLIAANATAPTPDTAEGFLRLRLHGPDRHRAVAVRLERTPGRAHPDAPGTWVCTALRYR